MTRLLYAGPKCQYRSGQEGDEVRRTTICIFVWYQDREMLSSGAMDGEHEMTLNRARCSNNQLLFSTYATRNVAHHSLMNSLARCIASYGAGQSRHLPCPRIAPASGLLDWLVLGDLERFAFFAADEGAGDDEEAARLAIFVDLDKAARTGRRSMHKWQREQAKLAVLKNKVCRSDSICRKLLV